MERKLEAKKREERGTGFSKRLRNKGLIPANLTGGGKSDPITVDAHDFEKLLSSGLRKSTTIQLSVEGGAAVAVLPKDVQRHPVSGEVLHIDFYKVVDGLKLKVAVPVELTGNSKGVKAGGALEHYIRNLKVRTVPQHLVEKIDVDITKLDVGQAIHLSDLNIPENWEIMLKGNPIICRVAKSRMTQMAAALDAPAEEGEAAQESES